MIQTLANQTLANEVRWARKRAGMSVEQLAERANLSPEYVRKIESGQREPSDAVVVCIARVLDWPRLLDARCADCPVGQARGDLCCLANESAPPLARRSA